MTAIIPIVKALFPRSLHGQILLVGGTVRDFLMNKNFHDIDLVATLSPEEILALGFRLVEASSGAAIYFTHHPDFGKIEVTLIDGFDDLEGELRRRDFTINAIAMDLNGSRIDPLGGVDDIIKGVLRACNPDSFASDPLRIFRAFRFESDGWRMTSETATLIRVSDWATAFSKMPIERFSSEMLKALAGKTPEIFFQRMIEFNAGTQFLPELFRMPLIPAGPLQHHLEGDLFTHSVQVLQRVAVRSEDPLTRFCAFFHDLGKLGTNPLLYPKHHGHDSAGFTMAVDFCNRLHMSKEYRNALAWTSPLHGKANLWHTLRNSTKITMAKQALKGGIVHILPLVAAADKTENQPMIGWDDAIRVAQLNTREMGIDQERLNAMPIKKRTSYITQKRIEALTVM